MTMHRACTHKQQPPNPALDDMSRSWRKLFAHPLPPTHHQVHFHHHHPSKQSSASERHLLCNLQLPKMMYNVPLEGTIRKQYPAMHQPNPLFPWCRPQLCARMAWQWSKRQQQKVPTLGSQGQLPEEITLELRLEGGIASGRRVEEGCIRGNYVCQSSGWEARWLEKRGKKRGLMAGKCKDGMRWGWKGKWAGPLYTSTMGSQEGFEAVRQYKIGFSFWKDHSGYRSIWDAKKEKGWAEWKGRREIQV